MAPPISWKSGGFSLSGSASVGGLTSASAPEPRSRQLGRTFTGRPLGDAGAPASSTFGKNLRGRVSGTSESQMSASVGSGASRDAASAPFDSRALAHTSQRDPETNTWRYIGAATANPSVRAQSGSLLRAFDVAMAAVEKGASAMEGDARSGPGGDDAKELTATVLGELFSVKSEVAAHFAQRATLERCIAFAAGKLAEDPGAAFLPAPPEVGLSERTWSLQKEGLASIWCEQKWTDLITGKLQDQAGAVSVEFGSLVRKLRHRNASLVDRALKLHSDALWQLEASAASVVALREAAHARAAATALEKDAYEADLAATRARVADLERNEALAAVAAKKDAEEKLERTRLALDTMKDLFHDLSREKTALAAFDLRDTAERLRTQLAAATEELGSLRLLRDEAATARTEAKTARVELKAKRRAMELQAGDLQERGDLVNELMMEKGELLASMAAAEKVKEEKDTLAGEKNEGKVADVQPPDDVEDFAQSVAKQIEENSILCVRCGRSLDHLEEITKQQATERDKRVRCLGYRVLLNPLPPGQRPPDRSHAWAQACMRSVVVAKARHDRLHAEESLCSRFPEFVHAWFAKQPVIELTQKERNRLLVMAQQGVKEDEPTVSDEDGNRWAFYAKVKQLAALGSTEANLFWLLLDETHGDDYLAFFLHCLTAIVSVAGATLHDQLGLCGRGLSYRQLALLAAKDDPNLRKTDGSYDAAVLVKHLDSCVRGTGVVFVYLAQAYATLDALLVGPLKLRGEVVKKAVRGLAHPATESKLGDFDDGKGLPRDDANVWLLYGTVPRDTVVPKPKEPKKRAGDDGDAPEPKAETPRTYCLRAAKEANKDAHDGLTLAIDMFSFLQVLMHIFKDEQSTRNAAVRVMFGAAAGPRGDFGSLTSDSISAIDKATAELKKSNGDLAFAKLPKDLTLDLPKFASVARALWPRCSIVESNGMYRQAFELTHGRVDHEVFNKIMETHRVTSRALELPPFVGVGYRGALGHRLTTQLVTLVHRRFHFAFPMLKRVRAALPEPSGKRFGDAMKALLAALGSESPTRGVQALSLYRDVLRRALALRSLQQDTNDLHAFLVGIDEPRSSTTALKVEAELAHVESVLTAFDPGDGDGSAADVAPGAPARGRGASKTFDGVRRRVAARKLVAKWKERVAAAVGPPPGVLLLMRRGYAQGRGAIHRRRIHKSVDWVHGVITQIYRVVLDDLAAAGRRRLPPRPFDALVYEFHLDAWGVATLADRAVHDLFFNVRNMIGASKRCKLFAAFLGIHADESQSILASKDSTRLFSDPDLKSAALSFFFHAVAVLSELHCASDRSNAEICCLFPATFSDTRGKCESWLVPVDVVPGALAAIFDREAAPVYEKTARERADDAKARERAEEDDGVLEDLEDAIKPHPNVASYDELLKKAGELPRDDVYGEPHVDADGVLWHAMLHWRDLVCDGRDRCTREKVANATYGGHGLVEDEAAVAEEAARVALLSVDHFARLARLLGLHALDDDPLDDVAAYRAALGGVEACPAPPPLDVVLDALRKRHVLGLHGTRGHGAALARDNERGRRSINACWQQYEQIVVNHVNKLEAKVEDKGDEADEGGDGDGDGGEGGAAAARVEKNVQLQKHLKLLQFSLTQIRDVSNAAIPGDVQTVAAAFGYDDAEYVRAFKRASDAFDTADEKQQNVVLCDVARVVARELRCFYSGLYASQVEAAPEATRNTTEFFRDKWADGRNTVRAIANASRMVGSSKKLGA